MPRSPLRLALLLGAALALPAWSQPSPEASPPTPAAPVTAMPAGVVVGDRNMRLSDRIPPEQQLQLQVGDDKFAARYIADLSPEHRGAVIVLHDSGQHQSWPFTVAALLDELPLHGWSTLALELPPPAAAPSATVPAPAATPAAAPPTPATAIPAAAPSAMLSGSEDGMEKQAQARIDAAVKKLAELHGGATQQTVLIGFGSGAWRAVELARRQAEGNGAKAPEPIRALVLIDPRNRLPAAKAGLPKLLPTTALPTLDIVQNSAAQTRADAEARRRAVLHQKERIYQQLALPPLNAREATDQTVLIKRIRSWIQRYVPLQPEKPPAPKP